MHKIRLYFAFFRTTIVDFFKDLPLIHGAALAYYVLLALVPLLYLSVSIFGQVVGHEKMLEIIETMLREQIGLTEPEAIISFLGDVNLGAGDLTLQITGSIMVVLSSTAILGSLRKSINKFYGIEKPKLAAKKVILKELVFRAVSMVFIVGVVTLLIVLYFAETVFLSLGNQFLEDLKLIGWFFSEFARHGLPIITNVVLFSFVFKYLHDGRLRWGIAVRGAAVTGVFLYLGQLFIKYYLGHYFFASGSGVAGTMLMLLVWVYYSALILFLGVKFTAAYAKQIGEPIQYRD